MIVIGLTGSIAMGKSTTASMFRRLGIPVFCADEEVHRLLGPRGAAREAVSRLFPTSVGHGAIDRDALARHVFQNPTALAQLESILHPMVKERASSFLRHARRTKRRVVVLDIPLLFEAGWDQLCDMVVVVSAPAIVQRQRLLARPGMTSERIRATLSRQLPDAEKRRRANTVLPTGLGRAATFRAIRQLLDSLPRVPPKRAVWRQRGGGWQRY